MCLFTSLIPGLVYAQGLPPSGYYTPITNQTGATLKSALHDIIKGHTVIPYDSSSRVDTHDALVVLDRDPANSANVLLIYSGYSVPASTWPNWNREHIWPQSYGVSSGDPNSDLFNLRACDAGINSTRGNKYFDVSTGSVTYPVNAPGSSYDNDSWEPRDADKGFVARACLYMTTRYDGTGGDVNLKLADSPAAGSQTFAKLSTLLDWNRRFPPADWERTRGGLIYADYQRNRNPFIDNPDYADMVFLGIDGFAAWQGTHFTAEELSNASVATAGADPDGDGLPNLAEYAFGHDPNVADGNPIYNLTIETVGETNYLYLVHHRHHYLSGVDLTYQISTNMTDWDDVAPQVVTNMQVDAVKDLKTVRFPANNPSAFVRFKVHRLADVPVIVANGSTLLSETCSPPNGLLDPGETVGFSFSLKNVGSRDTSNLVVTLLATGGVTSPSGPQNYGVISAEGGSVTRSFTFTADGNCGGSVTATLQLQDGAMNLGTVTYTFLLGDFFHPLDENFDTVTAPTLPGGWTTSASGVQSNWVTSTTQADSPPNAAFSADPAGIGINELVSPSFFLNSASAQLTFEQRHNMTANLTNSTVGYDGGVLEIKIGNGSFQDILAAGGSFVSGGYNATLSGDYGNPLAGRQAWSGNSLGFFTTTVNLPAAAAGENVRLRWRCGVGNPSGTLATEIEPLASSGTLAFWNFDTTGANPNIVATNISVSPITVSNVGGSLTFFQGNPSTGSAIASSGFTTAGGPPTTNYSHFAFAIAVTNGFQASFSSLSFDDRASATGPKFFNVQISQQSNFSSIIYDSGAVATHASFAATPMNTLTMTNAGLTGTIYFRIYAYGASSANGTWRLDNMNLQGEISQLQSGGGGWFIDSVTILDPVCCGFDNTPPVASFTANPTNGAAPLVVTFTDTSTGGITNRFWDFGDATTTNITTSSVTHTYTAGTYTVTLVVAGANGVSTNTQTNYITVLTAFEAWQIQYFGSTNNPAAAPDADPDGDGQNNMAEFLAGTDPTSGTSLLRILSVSSDPSGDVITWSSVPGKAYQPQWNSTLETNTWLNVSSPVTAGVSQTTLTITNPVPPTLTNRFYRIGLAQ